MAVYLYANVVDIEIDAQSVRILKIKTLTGRTAEVKAKIFVLAAGGIENARLLLVSNNVRPAGLGNHNDLVGRYFMDHARLYSGRLRFRQDWARNLLYDFKYHFHNKTIRAHGTCVAAQLSLAAELQRREQLLNARVCFSSVLPGQESSAAKIIRRTKRRLFSQEQQGGIARDALALVAQPIDATAFVLAYYLYPRFLVRESQFQAVVEPLPDPDSRVTLSQQKDKLGMNRVKVDWRLGSLVKRTFDRTLAIIAEELDRAGIADVTLDPKIENGEWPKRSEVEGCFHHMGTTRMHDSPKLGVVDRNCRVRGVNNLYTAGSSVFPTAGANFPTITIVALAIRLSEQITKEMLRPLS